MGNAVLLPKVGNENTKTRQISSNFVRFFTKNHEKEEKLYDFTQFREARLPKLGKIIQQMGSNAKTGSPVSSRFRCVGERDLRNLRRRIMDAGCF